MNVRMEITYQTPKGTETAFTSDEMRAPKALLIAEDLQKQAGSAISNLWTIMITAGT